MACRTLPSEIGLESAEARALRATGATGGRLADCGWARDHVDTLELATAGGGCGRNTPLDKYLMAVSTFPLRRWRYTTGVRNDVEKSRMRDKLRVS
ncbi:hypothetical protein NDU88_005291 [Pleurodeles waltl]|uniref:Uncharacterized protein n=1 Tax=Pleurodeles waltl TaxID=8319 RepID=A0AAV7TAV3_PLEWA|nr:hypothetical protein NDU88_005291 [Pleurodeles waltl]